MNKRFVPLQVCVCARVNVYKRDRARGREREKDRERLIAVLNSGAEISKLVNHSFIFYLPS